MSVTTAGDIIRLALKDSGVLGVGQTASAEDTQDAFDTLNLMLDEWNQKRWMIYHLLDVSVVSTGAQMYTIGVGGDFNTPRPDRLEDGCFYRQLLTSGSPNQIDYPLEILESREDYSRIGLKQLQTIPQYVFYDPDYPLGKVYPWPVPQAVRYEIHLAVKAQLSQFTSTAATIILPPVYLSALRWNLALRLRPMYQLPPDMSVLALAKNSLNTIKNANAQIPRLRMPAGLGRGPLYNIYSDSNY